MYDVDLFDVPDGTLTALRGAGRIVICYFSAGTREDWRADAADFPPSAVGLPLPDWPGEAWLDIRDPAVRAVLTARLDRAVTRGCDGVEPDNVDGYDNANGFQLTAQDQQDFNVFLANAAHQRGLSVGLKNALGLVTVLEPHFDWALNEECVAFQECAAVQPFVAAGKAVFHAEYVDAAPAGAALATTVCADSSRSGFSTLIKTWELDAWRIACP